MNLIVSYMRRATQCLTNSMLQINLDDRVLLLKSCCMEIMCLRAACRYNNSDQSLTLSNGYKLYKTQLYEISHHGVSLLMAPIFEFAKSISKLDLNNTEVAMLAAVLLMQSGVSLSRMCRVRKFRSCLNHDQIIPTLTSHHFL